MAVLSPKGVLPEMRFKCCDCGDTYTGAEVIADTVELHIVHHNREAPLNSTFRCECCHEEHIESSMEE